MGTKLNPGRFDCYANALPDEPMFVLLARDPLAPQVVDAWASAARFTGVSAEKRREAIKCADDMWAWLRANPEPDGGYPKPAADAPAERTERLLHLLVEKLGGYGCWLVPVFGDDEDVKSGPFNAFSIGGGKSIKLAEIAALFEVAP